METNRFWGVLLIVGVVVGVVVGYLLPQWYPYGSQQEEMTEEEMTLESALYDPAKLLAGGLQEKREGFEFSLLAQTPTGSVELFKIDKGVKLHKHEKENHFLYILTGKAEGEVGGTKTEAAAGQLVQIPKGIPHQFKSVGDEPLTFLLFSTPQFNPDDIVWIEE